MADTIPFEALDDRIGFVGTSGSGKTYNAGVGVERVLNAGGRALVIDPLGVWWGLGLSADGKRPSPWRESGELILFGGNHGDLPLNEHAGKLIGETVSGMAESAIIDLSALGTKASEIRFMLSFLTALYKHASGNPLHLIFDEADMWAPQQEREKGEGPKLLGMMETVIRRGRVRGFIPWLISQRPAVLNKNVLAMVDGLIAFKLTSSQDRKAIGEWVKGQADEGQWSSISDALPTMERGQALIWLPSRSVFGVERFPAKVTFDSSRTPARGEAAPQHALKPINLDTLKGRLATVEEEAKANDPAALKAEVQRLTRELAKAERAKAAPPKPERIIANTDEIASAKAEGERLGVTLGIARAIEALKALRIDGAAPVTVIPRQPRSPKPEAAPIVVEGDVPPGCAKPLAALAAVFPSGLTEAQWATAAGYKRSGGTWGTYKSRLRGAGLIERQGDRWHATEAGAKAVGDVELPPPPGPDLVRWWAAKLPGTSRIAEALIEAGQDGLSREELAARVEMSASGGSFGTYLSRLAGPGLIDRSGGIVRLSREVMGG